MRQRGFSLIEILVVVFIIGVIAGFATLSLSGRALDDRLQEEANRLHVILRLAAEESTLTGREIGWLNTARGYRFMAVGPEGWTPYGDESPLRARSLEEPMFLKLKLGELAPPEQAEVPAPQVIFWSSGELTPFEATLAAPQHPISYRISGQITGALSIERISES